LNAWIKDYAKKSGAIFADYYAATVDTKGMLKEGFSNDGLHPNEKGYALMAPIASAAIAEALR
jgi:lysophospholipase L1-like esterase